MVVLCVYIVLVQYLQSLPHTYRQNMIANPRIPCFSQQLDNSVLQLFIDKFQIRCREEQLNPIQPSQKVAEIHSNNNIYRKLSKEITGKLQNLLEISWLAWVFLQTSWVQAQILQFCLSLQTSERNFALIN